MPCFLHRVAGRRKSTSISGQGENNIMNHLLEEMALSIYKKANALGTRLGQHHPWVFFQHTTLVLRGRNGIGPTPCQVLLFHTSKLRETLGTNLGVTRPEKHALEMITLRAFCNLARASCLWSTLLSVFQDGKKPQDWRLAKTSYS